MPSSDFYIGEELKDFYTILGVSKGATTDEIKKAYKKGALEFHPDKNKQPGAAEIFKKIGEAYEVLKNPDSKKEYDKEYHLALEKKLARAQYFSGRSQPNYQSTQQPQGQTNQRESGDQSNQRESGDQGARRKDDDRAYPKTSDEYNYKIIKINNYIDNLKKDWRELLRLQRQTRSQLDTVYNQNDWAMVVNYLKQLRDLQQQEQTTKLEILSWRQDLVAFKTKARTMGQTFFSGNKYESLESLQTEAEKIKQEIEEQPKINADNNQEIQLKIDYAKTIEKMQTSVIAIENKIAMVAQQKNIAMQSKRKNMQDRMQAQRTARLYWNQGDVGKAIIAERNGIQLFIDENQQLLNQVTAELREAELQQTKVKYLIGIVKNKNLLFPNKALQTEHKQKQQLEKMWKNKITQYNNKVMAQQMEYNASVAMKDKIALIEDLQKTRIAVKKFQEQLLINPNFLGANQSSLRNKSFQEYQRLSQWLEHKYLNKNFWNKPYDEIKDALEEIKDAANNIRIQQLERTSTPPKPGPVPLKTNLGFSNKAAGLAKAKSKEQSAIPPGTNKPAAAKSNLGSNNKPARASTAAKSKEQPVKVTLAGKPPVIPKSKLGFTAGATKGAGLAKASSVKVKTKPDPQQQPRWR